MALLRRYRRSCGDDRLRLSHAEVNSVTQQASLALIKFPGN